MSVSAQLCGLLVVLLCSYAESQERIWHTTSITPGTNPTSSSVEDASDTGEDARPVVPEESVAVEEGSAESPEPVDSEIKGAFKALLSDLLQSESQEAAYTERQDEKKQRKWMSLTEDEKTSMEEQTTSEQNLEETSDTVETSEDDFDNSSESIENIEQASENDTALSLPQLMDDLLDSVVEGVPMVHETIISKKTTVFLTISDISDREPVFVNLTGIRDYTGQERRIVGGVLDLSDLYLTGDEVKEVIQRMSRYKYHRIDLSNNNIVELPANTFSPVAFSLRELRLDGNPLHSAVHGELSGLQRGGLFHLTELRELNLSSCGLQNIDLYTPWNSNHLELIDLSNNNLRAVPTNLQFFHNLKKLFLDGNPITEIKELPFALLWGMQTLSMSSCEVASISGDPFRNMERIKELSLAGNRLSHIAEIRLPRGCSGVRMYLSGNPWHCACDMLTFVERYHYAIRDLEAIRCASPRWLEGLRTAYLTKEILSLDSMDGDCNPSLPQRYEVSGPATVGSHQHLYKPLRADRLEMFSLTAFALAAVIMLVHLLCSRKRVKVSRAPEDRDDINYIRIDKKPNFK